jgi:hypothetical protein
MACGFHKKYIKHHNFKKKPADIHNTPHKIWRTQLAWRTASLLPIVHVMYIDLGNHVLGSKPYLTNKPGWKLQSSFGNS